LLLNQKIKFFEQILGPAKKAGYKKGQYLFYCPFCKKKHYKPKLAINFFTDAFKCWICTISGKNLFFIIKRFSTKEKTKEWEEITGKKDHSEDIPLKDMFLGILNTKKVDISLPLEYKSFISKNISLISKTARNYLTKRGITEKDIIMYKIGYAIEGELRNRIIFLSFSDSGDLNFYTARNFLKEGQNYINSNNNKNEIIFNELLVDFNEPIILVEGVFDAIKAGTQAIPLLGSTLNYNSNLFQKLVNLRCNIYLALDSDAQEKELKIAQNFIGYGNKIYKIPLGNRKDIGEMTKEEFLEAKEKSFLLTNEYTMLYKLYRI